MAKVDWSIASGHSRRFESIPENQQNFHTRSITAADYDRETCHKLDTHKYTHILPFPLVSEPHRKSLPRTEHLSIISSSNCLLPKHSWFDVFCFQLQTITYLYTITLYARTNSADEVSYHIILFLVSSIHFFLQNSTKLEICSKRINESFTNLRLVKKQTIAILTRQSYQRISAQLFSMLADGYLL